MIKDLTVSEIERNKIDVDNDAQTHCARNLFS